MALTEQDRISIMRELIRKMFVDLNATAQLDTSEVKAAVDKVDQFMNDLTVTQLNAAGAFTGTKTIVGNLNDYLPSPFKETASAPQKALVVSYWAMKIGGLI